MSDLLNRKALGYLARREHSRYEIIQKLSRFADIDQCEIVADSMIKLGYQSDERFALSRLRHRASQGYGPFKCEVELLQHQIDKERVSQLIADYPWKDVWQQHLTKCSAATGSPAWLRYWHQRGFSLHSIKQWIQEQDNTHVDI